MGFLEEVAPELGLEELGSVWIVREGGEEGREREEQEQRLRRGGMGWEQGRNGEAADVRGGLGSIQTISSLRPQQSSGLQLQDICPAAPSAAGPP